MEPNDWLTFLGMLGKMGQGTLAGTDKQWIGNMGGYAGQMAGNVQAASASKEFMDLLRGINNPNASKITEKSNPQTGEVTRTVEGKAIDPNMPNFYAQPAPQMTPNPNVGSFPPQLPSASSPTTSVVQATAQPQIAAPQAGTSNLPSQSLASALSNFPVGRLPWQLVG
jgi:hypothetical protein